MIHTTWPRDCVVFLLLCELTRSAIYGSQKSDSHKWPSVLVDEVKGKPCNFEACLCGSLYSFLTTYMHFNTNAFQRPTRLIQGNSHRLWGVVAVRIRAPTLSSGVSVQQSVGSNPGCVLEQDT